MSITGLIGATKDLGARLLLVGVLPAASLALFVLALVWSGAPGNPPDLGRVVDEAKALGPWEGGLLFLAIVVAAVVSLPLQLSLVRVLEGYWGDSPVARVLARPGKALHGWRRRRLAEATVARGGAPARGELEAAFSAGSRLRRLYPPEAGLLPTGLGNVLRAAEHRAGSRYGLEAVVMWPRLYPLLPDRLAGILDDERDQLDLAARFCAVFVVATAVSAALLAPHGWWLLVPAAALGLAWLSYRAAVAAALAYGEGIEAAFDLHRFDLLRALHLELPRDRDAEREANAELSAFLLRGQPVNFAYDHGAESERGESSDVAAAPPPVGATGAGDDGAAAEGTRAAAAGAAATGAAARDGGLLHRVLTRLGGS